MTELQSTVETARVTDERFLDYLASAADMVGARRFREAEVEVLRALSITPSDLRALKLLALVRFKLGRFDESRTLCREIAATLPRDPGIRLKLGLIALKLDRVDESVHELEIAARLAPDDLRAWSYLGFAYARRGERARAAGAFRRAGQEALAVETENELSGRFASIGTPGAGTPARTEGDGSGPKAVGQAGGQDGGHGFGSGRSGSGSGRVAVSPGAVPGASYEPAFDQSAPMETRERTDSDRPSTGSRGDAGATGLLPVAPLVGFAVSRLGPPTDKSAWVGAGARLAIADGAFVRADAAVACAGVVRWEEVYRRVQGRPTSDRLGRPEAPFFRVRGRGDLFVSAPVGRLVPLLLEDDVLYLREDCVVAFEGTVSWEYGHIPRTQTGMLQFRGRGLVAICTRGEPGAVKVSAERPVQMTSRHLLGWIGRVVAYGGALDLGSGRPISIAGSPSSGPLPITCEGEGVVLFDVERVASGSAP